MLFYSDSSLKNIYIVICCVKIDANSILEVKLYAFELSLRTTTEWIVNINTIFTYYKGLKQALEHNENDNNWRLNQRLVKLRQCLELNSTCIVSSTVIGIILLINWQPKGDTPVRFHFITWVSIFPNG